MTYPYQLRSARERGRRRLVDLRTMLLRRWCDQFDHQTKHTGTETYVCLWRNGYQRSLMGRYSMALARRQHPAFRS